MILYCTVILYCNAGEGDGWRLSLTESLGGLLVREKVAQVARLYCTVLYCTVLYCTVLYCTILYCTVLYCTVLYCTVLHCTCSKAILSIGHPLVISENVQHI